MEVDPAQLSKVNDAGRLATHSDTLRMLGVAAKSWGFAPRNAHGCIVALNECTN